MKKKIIYVGIILFSILIQTSFLPIFSPGQKLGDAVLSLILALAVLEGFSSILVWTIVAGVLYDFLSYSLIGQHVMIFLLVIYGVSFFSRRLSVDVKGTGLLLLFLFVVAATLVSKSLLAYFVVLGDRQADFFQIFGNLGLVVSQVGFNIVLFAFWFNIVKKIKKMSL